jgi:hypothetical protein
VQSGQTGIVTGLAAAMHTSWVQYVVRDTFDPKRSVAEHHRWEDVLLEIRWTFAEPKSLRERMRDAVSIGESVSWRVIVHRTSGGNAVCAGGACDEFNIAGLWRFSSAAHNVTARFDAPLGGVSFSTDDGQWGAARIPDAIVDGNARANGMGWGVGNRRTTDGDTSGGLGCSSVVVTDATGSASLNSHSDLRSMIYLEHTPTLFFEETIGHPATRLLVVTTATSCAQTLAWGSTRINWAEVPAKTAYLSNIASNASHTRWVQYVTKGGIEGTTGHALAWDDVLFEIEWVFDEIDSVEARFAAAATLGGVHVTWNVIEHLAASATDTKACGASGKCRKHTTQGMWRFALGPWNRFQHLFAGMSFANANAGPQFWGDAGASGEAGRWGVGSPEARLAGDTSCSDVYMDSVKTQRTSVRNVIHVVATNTDALPFEVVMPTPSPTMPPTPSAAESFFQSLAALNWGMIAIAGVSVTVFVCCTSTIIMITTLSCALCSKRRKKRSMIMNVYPAESAEQDMVKTKALHAAELNCHLDELKQLHMLGMLSDSELKAFEAGLATGS